MNITLLFTTIFFILTAGVIAVIFLTLYNIMVAKEEGANVAWAKISALYRKKADLIPALLESAEKYSQYEKNIIETVSMNRSKAVNILDNSQVTGPNANTDIKQINECLNNSLAGLTIILDKYPQLKTEIHYQTIQGQIINTENSIAGAYLHYNQATRDYNTTLRYFPINIIAEFFKFKPKGYFETVLEKGAH